MRNLPLSPRSQSRLVTWRTTATFDANLNATACFRSTGTTRAITWAADAGVAEMCSFQPWVRVVPLVPAGGCTTHQRGSTRRFHAGSGSEARTAPTRAGMSASAAGGGGGRGCPVVAGGWSSGRSCGPAAGSVPAWSVPAWSVPAGSVPAGSVPAWSVPAWSVPAWSAAAGSGRQTAVGPSCR